MLQVKLIEPTPENSCLIELTQGKFAIVDRPEPDVLRHFNWCAIKWNFRWYAVAYVTVNGKRSCVAMHKILTDTPFGWVCHHYNRNSLDNRLGNLLNMTQRHHRKLHGIRRFGHKHREKTSAKRQ